MHKFFNQNNMMEVCNLITLTKMSKNNIKTIEDANSNINTNIFHL